MKFQLTLFLLLLSYPLWPQAVSDETLEAWEEEGDALMKEEDFEGAIKSFSRVVEATGLKQKSGYNALYKRAVAFYYLQKFDKSLMDLNSFMLEFQSIPQPYILRALVYRSLEDDKKQLEDISVAIRLQPGNPRLLKWRAGLFIDSKQYLQAKVDAQNAIKMEDDAEAETYLAFSLFYLGIPDSSLFALNRAIELDYNYMPSYLYAASFCLQSAEFELALSYIDLGLRVDNNHSAAWFYKGVALIEIGKIDSGCSCLNKAFYAGYDDAGGYLSEYCYKVEN